MINKSKKIMRNKKQQWINLFSAVRGLDFMLGGHNAVIGSEFLMYRSDPFNAEIGHLDPMDLRTFDQAFIDELVSLKGSQTATIPANLKKLCQEYIPMINENACNLSTRRSKYIS